MPKKNDDGAKPRVDPDDAPELTDEWFKQADVYDGEKLVRRGRPRVAAPRKLLSMRLEPEVIEGLRATGPGWQRRANDILKNALKVI